MTMANRIDGNAFWIILSQEVAAEWGSTRTFCVFFWLHGLENIVELIKRRIIITQKPVQTFIEDIYFVKFIILINISIWEPAVLEPQISIRSVVHH